MEASDTSTERLDKFLSNRGISSRRNIKRLLKHHTITVNGKRVTESGVRIIPESDEIRIDGKKIIQSKLVYFMLHKPVGIISTSSDELGRENVVSLIDTVFRIFPVGRLDKDTSGLILLTNDGELTYKLTHPRFHVPKTYVLTLKGSATQSQLKALRSGVLLDDGITNPADVKVIRSGDVSVLEVILHEGRNRQIRRMCEAVGIDLKSLKRIAFGPLSLGSLKEGEYRELRENERTLLIQAVPGQKS